MGAEADADRLAKSIATYERLSGVAWIVIGVVQVLALITIVAGVWNVIAGISRLGAAPHIERREHQVPAAFEGIGMLVAIGVVNLVFGGMFGLVMVAVDFYIRQRVLDNRHIFTHLGPA